MAGRPLASWNEGPAKSAILDFIGRVTTAGGTEYVAPDARIAAFDNDGTLWCEHPLQPQVFFVIDRVKALAAEDPGLNERQPFKALLEQDLKTLLGLGKQALVELAFATHAGMTEEQFDAMARDWIATATHPRVGQAFKDCAFRPQLELLHLLRANDFKIYIVTGGGVDFVRALSGEVYGVPRAQVIGSRAKTRLDRQGGTVHVTKLAQLDSFNDGEAKPRNISQHVGQRPLLAFGNSDGDLDMLLHVKSGPGARLALLLHHDDDQREVAYDRDFRLSPLAEALDKAKDYGLTLVSMKQDWKTVFDQPPEETPMTDAIAIDILLEPDSAMIDHAKGVNAGLRENYPEGFAIDPAHSPHITLVQRYVRSDALEAVASAVTEAVQKGPSLPLHLKAEGYSSIDAQGLGLVNYRVERTPDLIDLEGRVVSAVQPFAVSGGTGEAFARSPGEEINDLTIEYVEGFVPAASGEKYAPHVSLGVAKLDFVEALKREPFVPFAFDGLTVAIYQLGNFGTAQKRLWNLKQQ
jgi:hypothetical protein